MEPEILYGMEVSLNGTPLEISKDWDCYPALVRASFVTQEIAESPVWEFQFKFPRLVSPAQHGSEDRRNLAIRLRSITVRSID